MPEPATSSTLEHLPGPRIAPWRRTARYWVSRLVVSAVTRGWVRLRVEGRRRLPDGPAVLCFNHQSWADPFVLMATLPMRPRLFFFGPKEEDMTTGGRNRLMTWTGATVPYRPGKNDLLAATRSVRDVFAFGGVLAIAGEGRIGHRESRTLPLSEGPAFFALRFGVPVVPVAINGMTWIRFGGRVRVRVGRPIQRDGRATRETIATLTAQLHQALDDLVADHPELPEPGPVGRWLTELFNDWPEGTRPRNDDAGGPGD